MWIRSLVVGALIAQAVPMGKCGATVQGPKTAECPAGIYRVDYDPGEKTNVTYVCASPAASPSAPPSTPPSSAPSTPPPSPSSPPSTPPSVAPSTPPSVAPSFPPSTPPSAVPSAPPEGSNYPVPPLHVCTAELDVAPDYIGLGDEIGQPVGVGGDRVKIFFHATPRSDCPRCGHDAHKRCKGCEQWAACNTAQEKRGEVTLWWYSQYPDTPQCSIEGIRPDCGVEHPSRPCDADEEAEDVRLNPGKDPEKVRKDCRRPHNNIGTDVISPSRNNGGRPGVRGVCVAPWGHPEKKTCRSWDCDARGNCRPL